MDIITSVTNGPFVVNVLYDQWAECPVLYDEHVEVYAVGWAEKGTGVRAPDPETDPRGDTEDWWYFPLYRYEHGMSAYAIEPFACRWDSGCTGYIRVRVDVAEGRDDAVRYAESVCDELTAWANGTVYIYDVLGPRIPGDDDDWGDALDSCGGYIDVDEALDAGLMSMQASLERWNRYKCSVLGRALANLKPAWALYGGAGCPCPAPVPRKVR